MKANELMIGDWVVYRGDAEYTNPVRIEGMDILTCELITEDREDVGFDGIEPIPLTAEILEKNGFRKLVTYGTEKWLCNNIRLNVYSSDGTWRFCADTNRNENSVIYIHFVHELQHAFNLVGINKEITL